MKMEQEYHGKKKILMLTLLTIISCAVLALLSVTCYFVVEAVIPEKNIPRSFTKRESFTAYNAAVTSNGYLCADIGKDVLKEKGTAVDAAIATLICENVLCFQSMGPGGGFLMTIFDKKSGVVEVLNARETAPAAATENMFGGNKTLSQKGGLSVAIPSQLKGFHEAYLKYGGGVPWKRLFEPSIKIAKEGFNVQRYLFEHIQRYKSDIMASPTLKEILTNPTTGKLFVEGELIKQPKLGNFLEIIANEGITPFYEGRIAKNIVDEVKAEGGVITQEDLKNYKVQWMKPTHIKWRQRNVYSTPVPGSGEILSFILNLLNHAFPAPNDGIAIQRFIEIMKWGFGRRTELGDYSQDNFVVNATHIKEVIKDLTSDSYAKEIRKKIKDDVTSQDPRDYGAKAYVPDDHGTCHISVLSPNGDAVSVTSTINLVFGAKFASKSTGMIYNNEMADFSAPNMENPFGVPPSPDNYIRPGKRPLSSMSPTIFLNEKNEVDLLIGASGGTRITTTIAYVTYFTAFENKTIDEAIHFTRVHHQLFPMEADFEIGFTQKLMDKMASIGHKVTQTPVNQTSTVTAIQNFNGKILASFDYRRGGSVAGF